MEDTVEVPQYVPWYSVTASGLRLRILGAVRGFVVQFWRRGVQVREVVMHEKVMRNYRATAAMMEETPCLVLRRQASITLDVSDTHSAL